MPVSMVLSYVSQHYDLPKWIHLDPSQKNHYARFSPFFDKWYLVSCHQN
ncbi:hypothetical protein [Secundilactobacillus kimchicus]